MLTYAAAEAVLAGMYGLGSDIQGKAFRARLKHLKRLGVPLGSNPGRGTKIWYHDEQLFQWAFCLELAEFGVDPTMVVSFIRTSWEDIFEHFKEARHRPQGPTELCFYAEPRFMAAQVSGEGKPFDYQWRDAGKVRIAGTRRCLVINLSAMVREMDILRVGADSTQPKEQ
ncbi:hypothetical protein EN741_27435 [Mesorhizobium sp. M4B.F.Ca.ET.019.03.1.1]|uniref:hypothetical protein n=1 Tax=Mesorhizobium sp. M4B.F.Ca.ET.019.03.1.1 TaxID=2496651 RepID=UPI000FCAEC4E|nr:hypothetical protein [Mesorhizobium sp. M4B.F.Ca.ET.019.03.1.1]RVD35618.1 hypothetical protein EN741_27435 [Mesorhizobium sp. M4B.F.Ca.ET.019.03.1.1]